jgi:phosphatidylglycerol:prolipoprotein diacylglycerol transferase
VLLAFLALYAVLRFALELLRDDDRGSLGALSTSQIVSIVVVAAVAIAWSALRRRSARALAADPSASRDRRER